MQDVRDILSPIPALLATEFRKQSRLKLPYVGLVGAVIMAGMWPQTMRYYIDTVTPLTGYEFVASAMMSMSTSLIPIFVAVFAATLVAGETSRRTLTYILCRPVSRLSFLASKFLAAFGYAALMMAVGAVALMVVGGLAIGYRTQLDALLGVEIHPFRFWFQFVMACALGALPAFATAAYGLWLSVLFRNVGAAVAVAASVLVALEPLKHTIRWGDGSLSDIVWTTYFDTALDLPKNLASGTPDLWNTPEQWTAIGVSLLWIAVFAAMSTWIMLRRDWD